MTVKQQDPSNDLEPVGMMRFLPWRHCQWLTTRWCFLAIFLFTVWLHHMLPHTCSMVIWCSMTQVAWSRAEHVCRGWFPQFKAQRSPGRDQGQSQGWQQNLQGLGGQEQRGDSDYFHCCCPNPTSINPHCGSSCFCRWWSAQSTEVGDHVSNCHSGLWG